MEKCALTARRRAAAARLFVFIFIVFIGAAAVFGWSAARQLGRADAEAARLAERLARSERAAALEEQIGRYELLQLFYLAEQPREAAEQRLDALAKEIQNRAADPAAPHLTADFSARLEEFFALDREFRRLLRREEEAAAIVLLRGPLRAAAETVKLRLESADLPPVEIAARPETGGLWAALLLGAGLGVVALGRVLGAAARGAALAAGLCLLLLAGAGGYIVQAAQGFEARRPAAAAWSDGARAALDIGRGATNYELALWRGEGEPQARQALDDALAAYAALAERSAYAAEADGGREMEILRMLRQSFAALEERAADDAAWKYDANQRRLFLAEVVQTADYLGALRDFNLRGAQLAMERHRRSLAAPMRAGVAVAFAAAALLGATGLAALRCLRRAAAPPPAGAADIRIENEADDNRSRLRIGGRTLRFEGMIDVMIEYERCVALHFQSADAALWGPATDNVCAVGRDGRLLWNIQELLQVPGEMRQYPEIWKSDATTLLVWNQARVCYRIDMERFAVKDILIAETPPSRAKQ